MTLVKQSLFVLITTDLHVYTYKWEKESQRKPLAYLVHFLIVFRGIKLVSIYNMIDITCESI